MSIVFTNAWMFAAMLTAAAPAVEGPAAPAPVSPKSSAALKSGDMRACAVELRPEVQTAYDRVKELEQEIAVEEALHGIYDKARAEIWKRIAAIDAGAKETAKDERAGLVKRSEGVDKQLAAVKLRITELAGEARTQQDVVDDLVDEPAVNGRERRQRRRCERSASNARIEAQIEKETRSFRGAMVGARRSRCATAICWGPSYKFAFEPLAELPIGKTFGVPSSGLARYVNGNDIQVSFNAGVRFWMAWDWVSFAVYLSKPLLQGGDFIHVSGSKHEFATSQVRRPLPGIGVGLFGDMLWLSFDYDQLRNGNAGNLRAPEFPQNAIVSHAFTFTVAIAPMAGLRNGLGTLGEKNRREAVEAAAKEAAAKAKRDQEAADAAVAKAAEEKAAAEKAAADETTTPTPTGDEANG